MASAGMQGFRINGRGVIAVLKSQGVQDSLREVVEPIADRANAAYALTGTRVPLKAANGSERDVLVTQEPRIPPYGCHVDLGTYSAIGKVVCKTALGRADNARNNTILKAR